MDSTGSTSLYAVRQRGRIRRAVNVTLPPDMVAALDQEVAESFVPRSRIIEKALRERYGRPAHKQQGQ